MIIEFTNVRVISRKMKFFCKHGQSTIENEIRVFPRVLSIFWIIGFDGHIHFKAIVREDQNMTGTIVLSLYCFVHSTI